MRIHVADHPLIAHKLTVLRDRQTPSATFRQLVDELVTLLAYEATREVAVTETAINTPVAPTVGRKLSEPRPIVVPVLRAGLGMLEGMTRLLPTAEVGFLGMRRDDDTLEIETYANRLPDDLSGRQCYVLDPMLATGHTMVAATDYLFERGARDVTCVCVLAAPEGIETLEKAVGDRADVTVVVAAVDECLNDKSYIVPGLGDAATSWAPLHRRGRARLEGLRGRPHAAGRRSTGRGRARLEGLRGRPHPVSHHSMGRG